MRPPVALTGIVLRTPLLEETAAFYEGKFGLRIDEQTADLVALSGARDGDRPLVLKRDAEPGLDGLLFAMRNASELALAREEAEAEGLEPQAADPLLCGRAAFSVRDPAGTVLNFCAREAAPGAAGDEGRDGPLFLSHIVLNAVDPAELVAFYTKRLGFTVSDAYEKGLLTFLRCDQPQHHCVGISPGASNGLNHFAMDTGGLDRLMRGVSRLRAGGHLPLWGPGRHGPGGNIFAYFEDPTGFVPELTCDVLQIEDEAAWVAQEWARTPENGNVWLSGPPSPRALELMSGDAFPSDAARAAAVTR